MNKQASCLFFYLLTASATGPAFLGTLPASRPTASAPAFLRHFILGTCRLRNAPASASGLLRLRAGPAPASGALPALGLGLTALGTLPALATFSAVHTVAP